MHRSTGDILDRVVAGEEMIIARNGVPIARLLPIGGPAALIDGVGAQKTRQVVGDEELIAPIIDEM